MSYQHFAHLYDQLMSDAPYHLWVEYLTRKLKQYKLSGQKILDIGCGTGELTIRLAALGYDVTGVDLSTEMLAVAQMKANEKGMTIPFYHQNMSELKGFHDVDAVIIFCDSLNYLLEEENIRRTFRNIYHCLKDGGLLLFDVHSLHKVNKIFIGNSFSDNDDDVSYIWSSFEGELENSVEHELTFFSKSENNDCYYRYDELHIQRTFPVEFYMRLLKETGFEVTEVSADFTDEKPMPDSGRVFFCASRLNID